MASWRSPTATSGLGPWSVTTTSSDPTSLSDGPILADTAAVVADSIVRNLGTLAGSIAHADPADDWGAALPVATAEVVIASPRGRRTVPP